MNVRLTLVFLTLFAAFAAGRSRARSRSCSIPRKLRLASVNAVVVDASANRPVYAKGADDVTPIASLTKLMTAIVTLDAELPLDEMIAIDMDDLDFLKGTRSRLRMGAELPRREMLRLALMSSENRAASSLARHLSRRHAGVRRGDERQGRDARHDAHAIRRSDGPLAAERLDGERSRAARRGRGGISADPRLQHHRQPLRRSAADGTDPRLQQHQQPRQEQPVGHPAVEDRLHPRGRQVPRHAGDDRSRSRS